MMRFKLFAALRTFVAADDRGTTAVEFSMIALPSSSKISAGMTLTHSGHNDCVLLGSPAGNSWMSAPVCVISGCRTLKSDRLAAGNDGPADACSRSGGAGANVCVLKLLLRCIW